SGQAQVQEPAAAPVPVPEVAAPVEPAKAPQPAVAARRNLASPTYSELVQAGEALGRGGQARDALDAYERALALRPDGALALSHIAYLHLNRGDNAAAKQFAARAVIADPTNSEGWIVLGAVQDTLGDREGARAAYRKCASLGVGPYVRECQQLVRQ
ncbi:MAG TPA: tetratricopeptide repeat protein, partial [Polyangiales bacterium]|nr:tetratricopeptide repeat protein [Polyangiales bacterium]